jgi:fibronectin-binding autotransporter adhesin
MDRESVIRTTGDSRTRGRRAAVFAIASVLMLIALLGAGGLGGADASALTPSPGDTHTWTGAGANALWSTAVNWSGNTAPSAGDSLIFPASPTSFTTQNDYAAGTSFGSITIGDSGYAFSGNQVSLTGGITTTNSTGTVAFAIPIQVAAAQTFTSASGGILQCTGALSGSGALTKSGSGRLWLYQDNSSFSGTVTAGGGRLEINNAKGLGTGAVTVSASSDGSVRVNGSINVANNITINGSGDSGQGALVSTAGDNVWSGNITVGSSYSMIGVNSASTLEIQSIVNSANVLVKQSPGRLTVTEGQTFAGSFSVYGGTLRVDGSLPTACAVTLESSGSTLDGTGTTGPVTVKSGATLAPGHSPGVLTTAGVDLKSGGTFGVEINGTTVGTDYDQVVSSGSVSLGGSTLSMSVGYTPVIGDSYTIISKTSGGAVSGTFAGLAEGDFLTVGGKTYKISYTGGDGNDVVITRAHVPTTFQISAGNGQSAPLNTAFSVALKVRLLDEDSNPLSGASVTFTAPGSGASGTFASSSTVTTDASGYATAPTFTANTTLGDYLVTASSAHVTDLSFSLTNAPGIPHSLTIQAGNDQTAQVGATFATRLKVLVKDTWDNVVPGASVTFTAPGSGAGGTFAGSNVVTSDAGGYAEAPPFTANGTGGSYTVLASCTGVASPAVFNLTNTGQAPAITSADAATFPQGVAASFTVTSTGTPKAALTETGALPSGVTFVDNGDGTATIGGTPASGTAGDYAITIAADNGVGAAATQAFVLHVSAAIAPVTTVRGVPSGWVKNSVRLTFTAKPGSGGQPVDYTEYRVGSGGWARGAGVTVARQGVTKVSYRSISTAGGVEATQVCTVRIDSTTPVVTDYGHPVSWQGGTARFSYSVADAGAPTVRAKLVITRYGWHARTIDLGRVATGKRLSAIVGCGLPIGTWNWRVVVYDPAGARGAGRGHTLQVYPR